MTMILEYLNFMESNGRPLAEINPGSDEVAFCGDDVFEAIEILKNNNVPILGGDILSTESGKIIYAYQLWGAEYHYLNWYCDKMANESKAEYLKRSCEVAKKAITEALEVAQKLKMDCLIVLVT